MRYPWNMCFIAFYWEFAGFAVQYGTVKDNSISIILSSKTHQPCSVIFPWSWGSAPQPATRSGQYSFFSEWANARILLNGKPLFPCGVVHCYCKCFLHLADVQKTFEGLLYLLHRARKKKQPSIPWVIHYCPFWTNVVDIEWYPANSRNKVVLWGQGFFWLHLFGVMSCGRYDSPTVMIALTGTLRQALRSASHWWNYTYLHKIAWS